MSVPRLSYRPPAPGAYTPRGAFKNWIQILAPSPRNTDGSSPAPSPFASLWAAIRMLKGDELLKAQQIVQESTHLVTIPFVLGVKGGMTIQFQSRIFQIVGVPEDPDESHVELRLLCAEINQGPGLNG